MSSLKKIQNSSLASSNMVNTRRDESARLEKRRLEINAKLEEQMRRYARATGDKSVVRRRHRLGKSPNDWSPKINASGIKKPMKWYEKLLIAAIALLVVCIVAEGVIMTLNIDVEAILRSVLDKIFVPV